MKRKPRRLESAEPTIEDADSPAKPARKVVETKTITYEEAEPEIEEDESIGFEFEDKPYRRAAKSERVKARERWAKKRGAVGAQYRVRIDRLPMFDVNGQTGVNAERKYVKAVNCNAKFIDDDDYLETIRGMIQTGQTLPGAFWVQVFDSAGGVDSWTEFVDGVLPGATIAQQSNDPASPQIVVQMPNGQQQAAVVADPFADLDKTLKVVERLEKMRQAFGLSPAQNPEPVKAQLSPEEQLATVLLTDPDVKKKAIRNLLGSNGEGDSERGTLELLLSHAGEIGKAIEGIVDRIFSNVNQVRQNGNGQQAITQTTVQPAAIQTAQPAMSVAPNSDRAAAQPEAGAITPQDELLYFLIDACEANAPIHEVVAQINFSLIRWPELGDSIDALLNLPDGQLLGLATSLRPSLANAQHAKAWLETLITALTEGGADGSQETA